MQVPTLIRIGEQSMKQRLASAVAVLVVCTAVQISHGQEKTAPVEPAKKNPYLKLVEPWPEPAVLLARRTEAEKRPLFETSQPLVFTLTADFKAINKDRRPESTTRFPGVISVTDDRGREQTIKVMLSARGHFRRMARNCAFVPLRLEFQADETAGTVFEGPKTIKLGTHCQDDKTYDQHTLREYLTYPLFNLITPYSFRARLGRATYVDEKTQKPLTTRNAIFIEHENDVARRNGGRMVELPRTEFKDFDGETLNTMMLFEYMIGNTDFSLYANHNVRFVQDPSRKLFPVPYDFDLSGLVHAPYAIPDRRFGLRSVLDRLYRGPCLTVENVEAAAAVFRAKKPQMLALLDGTEQLDPVMRSEMKSYLEEFFRLIEKPSTIKSRLVDGCKTVPTM
jgi:hypothetical protein